MSKIEIIGQESITNHFKDVFVSERIPHALLIHGAPGSGQLALSLYLAQLLQCQQPESGSPCGQCSSCHKVKKGTHPDLHFVFPVPNLGEQMKKPAHFENIFREAICQQPYISLIEWLNQIQAEQKNPNISAEACRDALQDLSLHRFEGKYKVLIIWLPEFMGKEANILLKELEEPAPNTVIILASDHADAILPTILSRCQQIRTSLLTVEEVKKGVLTYSDVDENIAEEFAWLSNGNLGMALQRAQETDGAASSQFLDWLRAAYQGDIKTLTEWSDTLASLSKNRQKAFLQYFQHVLQQSLYIGIMPDQQLHLPSQELTALHKLKPILTIDRIVAINKRIDEDLQAIEQNANQKISFLALIIYVNQILRSKAAVV
jgi:DNA polymerase-3 subunit delta'